MTQTEVKSRLERIVQKIVNDFDPEKVILFGSWAWGKPSEDSDIDLLVIKNSSHSRRKRQQVLEDILTPRELPLDLLTYTSSEMEEKITQDRNLFLEDIFNNGKVLYDRDEVRG